MQYPDYVKERLAHGALCHVCPLNGQRKVGHDGPLDAEHLAIAEAPGEDEETWKLTGPKRTRYGRPLVGKSGYFFKLRYLASVGLALLRPGRKPEYPRIAGLRIHLMNVIMCRPPKNKIDSPEGKAAVRCCANSARWFVNEWARTHPNGMINPVGGTALSLLKNVKTPIEPYRGRLLGSYTSLLLPLEPENEIYKAVLRGKKPKEEWWPAIEWFLKGALVASRASLRKCLKQQALEALPMEIVEWTATWKKQKATMTRKRTALKKKASGTATVESPSPM